jgi:hypothetical protein
VTLCVSGELYWSGSGRCTRMMCAGAGWPAGQLPPGGVDNPAKLQPGGGAEAYPVQHMLHCVRQQPRCHQAVMV